MNLYLSELVSDLIEPVVSTIEGGEEVISTEDLLADIEELNSSNEEWSSISWWEGKTADKYIGCGKFEDDIKKVQYSTPSLCRCNDSTRSEDGKTKTTALFDGCSMKTFVTKNLADQRNSFFLL